MRKKIYLLFLLAVSVVGAVAQTVNTSTTVTWPFNLGTAGQVASFSSGTGDYFTTNYVTFGTNFYDSTSGELKIVKKTSNSQDFTAVTPSAKLNAASAEGRVVFHILPKNGLSFVPTAIAFDCQRYGTNGGLVNVLWKSSDGESTVIATDLIPARDNSGAFTHATYDLSEVTIPASTGNCALELYLYSLDNTKQVGFANVAITGNLSGSVANLPTYTLSVSPSIAGAGTVTVSPSGTLFDEGTNITVTATKNFGYAFEKWIDGTGQTVSASPEYSFSIGANTTLTAVFAQLNTYSLAIDTDGGKSYMVTPSPAGTTIDGKRMYEEGVNVTLTAASNPLLTFTNWSTGETSTSLVVPMTKNQSVTAVYSAVDYIVGWDFYKTGSEGRVADFYSTDDNETSALTLRKADGTSGSWLDKSQVAAGGYEGAPAAVNWQLLTENWYYQIAFNATDFTDIKVAAAMLYNYNAYSVQRCEYSLNGADFTLLGTYTMAAAKTWYGKSFELPADANHAPMVYIRWIPDYSSSLLGTTSEKDGTAISAIYVTANEAVYDDGTPPELVGTVPVTASATASATGKIVLTFDEKVKVVDGTTATLGSKTLEPAMSGKTITFPYAGLDYNTQYTFTLEGATVSDLAGNTLLAPIVIQFTTMARPAVTKKKFDFVVGVDGDFKAALAAATAASSSGNRFYVFFPDGEYNIGENTGDGNQMTTISLPNVSYVGESADGVVVYNKSISESINSTATMYFTSAASNVYMQDISLLNKMDYRTGTLIGRGVALWDQGSKNIYKNVKLLSNQDTYFTGSNRSYLENCEIHGTVDFICGGGDIFFNECLLYLENRSGNVIAAPATTTEWGYVFSDCTIDGFDVNNGQYRLARPWNNQPKSVFINTTMKVLPTAAAWGDPMNVVPSVFAEYNSMTSSGASVDLSGRRTTYTKDATTVVLDPVLTAGQAAQYTIENVLGGNDAWQPTLYTEQEAAPVVAAAGTTLTWDDSNYVLCWAVCKNGAFAEFVTTNSYAIPQGTAGGTIFTVRAANSMGGLGTPSNGYTYSGVTSVKNPEASAEAIDVQYFNLNGARLSNIDRYNGVVLVRTFYKDGSVSVSKLLLHHN
ncbi:MAG: pectinesterase family protein [Breznakibacter sp.]